MPDDDYKIHELTIESIINGMHDAMEHESPALRKLALNVGSNALEYLLRDFKILKSQHTQMTKILAGLEVNDG